MPPPSRHGSVSTICWRATCWNSSPSCGRRPSACRRRAASARRSTFLCPQRRKKRSRACPRSPAPCSTSWTTWRPSPRPISRTPRLPWRAASGRGARRCSRRSASTSPRRSHGPAPGSMSGAPCRNGRSRRPHRRPAAPRSSRARRVCDWRRWSRPGPNLAEARPTQGDYASAASQAFAPREQEDKPNVVLVEAGTGVGKTLGYVAPASLWAEKNGAPVWIATYTRNLQRQIDNELDRLHRDSAEKRRRVVIRKGRENYLCLLNFQEAVQRSGLQPENAVGLGLLARWALASRDGDMIGGDLPAWLLDLVGRGRVTRLADRRGECIYSACEHYRKCFVERTIRRARQADIVIANHALVMIQAAMGGLDDATRPLRYVFDEGHHLFDAADSAFGAHLSGVEASDLRRWLWAPRAGAAAARAGWNAASAIFWARTPRRFRRCAACSTWRNACLRPIGRRGWSTARCWARPRSFWPSCASRSAPASARRGSGLRPGMRRAAAQSRPDRGGRPARPVARADAGAGASAAPGAARQARERGRHARTQGNAVASRAWRVRSPTAASSPSKPGAPCCAACTTTPIPPSSTGSPIERSQQREIDVGMYRHYLDPTEPFVNSVIRPSHGAVITSATLRNSLGVPAAANDESTRHRTPTGRWPRRAPAPNICCAPAIRAADGLAVRLCRGHQGADRAAT